MGHQIARVIFFLVLIEKPVSAYRWHDSLQGVQLLTTRHQPRTRIKVRQGATSECSNFGSALIPRGGAQLVTSDATETTIHESEADSGAVVRMIESSLQKMFRTLMTISPAVLASVFQFLASLIQAVTGLNVVPTKEKKIKKASRLQSDAKSKKRRKKVHASQAGPKATATLVGGSSHTTAAEKAKIMPHNGTKENVETLNERRKAKPTTVNVTVKKASVSTTSTKTSTSSPAHKGAKTHLSSTIRPESANYRIQRELRDFLQNPPPHLSVKVGKNLRVWIIVMEGVPGTVYEGETFRLRVSFPPQYPTVPPSAYFIPPNIPVHEHVYTNGDICLSLLGTDWRPTMTAQSIGNSILSILSSAQSKSLPMDNARHAQNKPGQYQKDWVYHDDNC